MPSTIRKAALERLASAAQVEAVAWDEEADSPRLLGGSLSDSSGREPEEIIRGFLESSGDLYGFASKGEWRIHRIKTDSVSNRHVTISRMHDSIRVYPSLLIFWLDATGVIRRVKGNWPANVEWRRPEQIGGLQELLDRAGLPRKRAPSRLRGEPELIYYIARSRKRWIGRLAYSVIQVDPSGTSEGLILDVSTGEVLSRFADTDEVAVTVSGIGINNADETATSPTRSVNADDPGGGSPVVLLDQTRSVEIQTQDLGGVMDNVATYPLCADDDGDGAFTDITNAPRRASDRPEVDAHLNAGIFHDYLARSVNVGGVALFGRTGWANDAARKWFNLVHRGSDSQSSAYTRSTRTVYHGDGDGTALTYKPTLDTQVHEWTHGVQATEVTGGTNPNGGFDGTGGENFVLKEATADMFAAAVNRDGGWRFAAVFEDDCALPGATFSSTGSRLRGLRTPSAFGQIDHYYAGGDTLNLGFTGVTSDYNRVGILDKAAYLMASGGVHPAAAPSPGTYPPITVYGIGAEAFHNILYYTIMNLSGPADVFSDFRADMLAACAILYPGDVCKAQTIARAFDAVGIYDTGTTPPAQPAGPDPMITPWGARTDDPPYWQSPDVYTKDVAGNPAAPLKGLVNRLFARVRNPGTADANGVQVTFSFVPYGAGVGALPAKTIGTVVVNVSAGDSTGVEVEIAWDLTDLTDTNGGQWPSPLSAYDHFCVRVHLELEGDIDICNNDAQNNFGNVGQADSDGDGVETFIVGNATRHPRWIAVIEASVLPPGWKADLDIKDGVRWEANAVRQLLGSANIPWIPDDARAVLVPVSPGEIRDVHFGWSVQGSERYAGAVQGMMVGMATAKAKGVGKTRFFADVTELRLEGERFEARVIGRPRPKSILVQGVMEGTVDRRTGRFEGRLKGVSWLAGKRLQASLRANGELAAMATFSVVVMADDDQQGIDLGVPIIGDVESLRPRLIHAAASRPRTKRPARAPRTAKRPSK